LFLIGISTKFLKETRGIEISKRISRVKIIIIFLIFVGEVHPAEN